MSKSSYQTEANQILKELEQDLNEILEEDSEGSRCMKLLYQEVQPEAWVGRFQGYYKGEMGYFQFKVDLKNETLTVGKEI